MRGAYPVLLASLALTQLLIGCAQREDSGQAGAAADKWLGQWTGPEGTFLELEGGDGAYTVTIQNLDGPQTYKGSADGDGVKFDRNGVTEHIRATNGAGTGMKWLSDKSECLTIRTGEGYCRR
jgi:hypothetical protein